MSRAEDRTARLMERFEQTPEQDGGEPPAATVAVTATAAKPKTQRRLASANPTANAKPTANAEPAAIDTGDVSDTPANAALEPHTKRTFYVRTAHVERLETEHRRLNYELNGVKLVEILDAVLDEGFKHFSDIEARLRDRS